MEVGSRFGERNIAELELPIEVPAFEVLGLRVHVNRHIEEIGDHGTEFVRRVLGAQNRGLQNVQALQNQNVWVVDGQHLIGDDVVGDVVVHGRGDVRFTGFHLPHKVGERVLIV